MRTFFEAIIIGSGASGSVAAYYLAKAGFDVLLIEQGGFVDKSTNYDQLLAGSESAEAKDANGQWTSDGYPWSTSNVGGGTAFYGGASFRYREVDFDASKYIKTCLDVTWPYSYQDLAPYYQEIEEMIGVAKSIGTDPYEPPSAPGPLPPHPPSVMGEKLFCGAKRLGLRPFPTPLAINSQPFKGRNACDRSSQCIERVCPKGAKGDAFTTFLSPLILEKGENFRLLTSWKALELTQVKPHKVDGIKCLNLETKTEKVFNANVIILACNAIQSAALLLRSKSKYAPNGIGNDFDMVGRGLSYKLSEYVNAYIDSEAGNDMYLGPFSTVAITDYYLANDCTTGMGGLIYEAKPGHVPQTAKGKALLRVETIISDHPHPYNRVKLSNKKDTWGLPLLILDYLTEPKDWERLEYMIRKCQDLLIESGGEEIYREPSYYYLGSGHLHGTCRAGADPRQYVLDENSRVQSIDNLFIVDGSFMPYSGSVNPTLTIQAHALKTSRFIIQNFRKPGSILWL